MLVVVLVSGGVVLGLLLGRWWALLFPAALGIWIARSAEAIEAVPGWYVGLMYAAFGGIGIVAGVFARRRLARRG